MKLENYPRVKELIEALAKVDAEIKSFDYKTNNKSIGFIREFGGSDLYFHAGNTLSENRQSRQVLANHFQDKVKKLLEFERTEILKEIDGL